METATPTQGSELSSGTSPDFLVFGDSLKMRALRYVLQTLDMIILEPESVRGGGQDLRIAFDGCDAEACAGKATFVRSMGFNASRIRQFPIGRAPEIASLFAPTPSMRVGQGTIFDGEVEVYRECWASHAMRRFLEKDGADTILQDCLRAPIRTNATHLARYAGLPEEQLVAERFEALMQLLEAQIGRWVELKSRGDEAGLTPGLVAWSKAKAPPIGLSPPGPLYELCGFIRELDHRDKYATSVAKLRERLQSAVGEQWSTALSGLP